jgi:ketosteroid isomerase-like protein
MAHPNEELVRKGFDAFAKGDLETVQSTFADDIVWHVPGSSQLSGDYKGQGEVLGWLGKNAELSGGTLKTEVHDILANDEHAVALFTITAQREGKSLHDNAVQIAHVSGGKVTESWIHPGDQQTVDDFWS